MARRCSWIVCLVLLFPLLSTTGCDCGDGVNIACRCKSASDCKDCDKCKDSVCTCSNGMCKPKSSGSCTVDTDCATTERCINGKCVGRCDSDKDCPEGYICNKVGECVKKPSEGCQNNSECQSPKICCDLGDSRGKRCNYKKCLVHEDCRPGSKNTCVEPKTCPNNIEASCIKGVCQCEEPCGGADCGSDRCCDVSSNTCIDNPSPCPNLKCQDGFVPPDPSKFTIDPKTCKFTGPECKCEKMKPLEPGEMGTHSEIALLNGNPVISAYNKTYGDLVVGTQEGGGAVKWEYVDGVPSGAKVHGDPTGPRGGIREKGDDVGQQTSIAVGSDSSIHVSYLDVTHGALKYARKSGGKWTIHTVDKKGKGVGRFTSIALANGNPVIAYFVTDDGAGRSELRVARAIKADPAAEADWQIAKVVSAERPGCKGKCDSSKKEVCVQQGGNPVCKVPTAEAKNCKPQACKDGEEACVGGQCLKIIADSAPDLPFGVGLFPSLAINKTGSAFVAFYDNNKGDLKLASQQSASSPFTVKALKTKDDVGQFPSLVIDGQGKLNIAYIHFDDGNLYYLRLDAQLNPEIDELVDDGRFTSSTTSEDRLLSDCSLALDGQGNPRIVYQDASVQALKIAARQGSKKWNKVKLAGDSTPYKGAFGFFADQVIRGATSYISNFKYNLRDASNPSGIDLRTWK